MSSGTGLWRAWMCALALALIGVGVASCSGEPDRFDDRGYSQTTGSVQPGQRLASGNFRPPLPIPEAPLTAAVVSPKGGSRNSDRRGGAAATTARSSAHGVAVGKTAIKIAKRDDRPPPAGSKANNIARPAKLPGDQVALRSASPTSAQRKSGPVIAEQPPVRPAEGPAVVPATDTPAGSSKGAEAAPTFQWPVRGQVIAGFGSKANGQQNNGIDVAVPEDTAIRAADSGVVVYAGNQLKSYGNLLLVRHPNGYVTVYAHAKQLLVKGGDEIKRGQVIAKSGQSGEVSTPQVHFEIRKASAPVDPMPYLGGA